MTNKKPKPSQKTDKPEAAKSFASSFEKLSHRITKATGSPAAFLIALSVILAWGITGPVFHFSDTWQLVINTGTTIVTFLMVFVIQQSQNKDGLAIQLKLNELIASAKYASNRLIDVEDMTELEMETLHRYYQKLADVTKKELNLTKSHSVEEAVKDAKDKVEEE